MLPVQWQRQREALQLTKSSSGGSVRIPGQGKCFVKQNFLPGVAIDSSQVKQKRHSVEILCFSFGFAKDIW